MKIFTLILVIFAQTALTKIATQTPTNIPDPKPISRKLSVTHLSKQLKKIKLNAKDKQALAELNERIQLLSEKDQERLSRLVLKAQSPDPKVRANSWRKIERSRKLQSTGVKAMMGLAGGALGLWVLGFFRQGAEIRRLKKKWAVTERKLFYSLNNKQNEINSLSAHIASLQNQVGLFADHMYAKTSELANFVDGRPIY